MAIRYPSSASRRKRVGSYLTWSAAATIRATVDVVVADLDYFPPHTQLLFLAARLSLAVVDKPRLRSMIAKAHRYLYQKQII